MSFLSKLREYFHKSIDPFINFLVFLRISPNTITTSALFFLAITCYFIVKKDNLIVGLMLLITSIVDSLDGAVAKKVGSTKFGDFYDAFIDRLVEAIIFITIAYVYPEYYLLIFIALVSSFMVSYVAARAEVWTIGVKIKYSGIGGRAGRLLILISAFLLDKLFIGIYLIILIASFTMISRTITTFKVLMKK